MDPENIQVLSFSCNPIPLKGVFESYQRDFTNYRQMNATSAVVKNNTKWLNTMVAPLNSAVNSAVNSVNSAVSSSWMPSTMPSWSGIVIFLALVGTFIALMVVYRSELEMAWANAKDVMSGYLTTPPAQPTDTQVTAAATATATAAPPPAHSDSSSSIVEKVLPSGGKEVFSVSSNKFTYYDAEPLCKALGAELATYEQVKDAWKGGADWCNYGWVKGQMAVYPTSDDTYEKLQGGPEDQRMACGRPGVNGGYFDNPEMRFGVTCYGKKPPQSAHDKELVSKGAPVSADALAFDKKVSQFKTEADTIGVLPFNTGKWGSS
jgi:hypothetical protein